MGNRLSLGLRKVEATVRAEQVVIAQLTDMHISVGGHGPGAAYWDENDRRLRSAIRSLNAESERPAVVIGTGDLVECGSANAYKRLGAILADLKIPFWPLPGNHDSRVNIRKTFPDIPWEADHASWSMTVPGTDVQIVALDSTQAGRSGGFVDAQRLEWLANEVDRATWESRPCIVAMHHPPFLTGIDWMDAMGFEGLEDLRNTLTEHPPTRIISGHYHRNITAQVGATVASIGLATTLHVNLDLSNAAVPAIINDPIGYQLHCIPNDDHPQVITHTRFIDRASVAKPIQFPIG